MMSDDELRAELGQLADQATIEPAPLDRVQARGRRRTLYQRGGVVLAAFALVVGGTVVVTSMGDDGASDVATDDVDTTSTDDASEADGEDASTADDADGADDTSAAADDSAEATTSVEAADVAFDEGFYGGPQWLVPWGDGLLSFGERYVETEPSELVFDGSGPIGEYFSQEIIDLVAESGVTTIDEAMAVLEEAGFLDEATEIVTENPEVLEWFNTNAGGGYSVPFAEYSADGETWEPVDDFSWPSDTNWYPQVESNGTHLVVAEHQTAWDPVTGRSIPSPVVVHITTDLSTWTSIEVPYDAPTVADYVQLDVSPQQLVVTDDSWLLTVNSWQWIDIWSALPADVLDEVNRNGYDVWPTEDALEIVDWAWEAYEETGDAVATDGATSDSAVEPAAEWEEPEPTVIRAIPWSELPFTFEEYNGVDGPGNDAQAFLGSLGTGIVEPVAAPGDADQAGQITVTDAGLFTLVWDYPEFDESVAEPAAADYEPTVTAWFSADGRSWQERALPALGDGVWVDTAVAVENGLLVTVSALPDGQRFFVGAADGTGFREVDGPDLPGTSYVWLSPDAGNGDGVASVVDLGSASQPFFPSYEVTFTHDGFEITTSQDGEGNGSIVVLDADGEVVFDHAGHVYDEPPFTYAENSVSIVDDDGEVIVSIPHEVMEREVWRVESQAWDEYHRENPYVPDFWLVATRDGSSWTTVQLPAPADEYGWYGEAIVIGDQILIADGRGGWQSIPLG